MQSITSDENDRRVIPGIPGYLAERNGRIFSERKNRYMSPTPVGIGRYLQVHVKVDGKSKKFYLHNLILFAFVGPRPEGMECLHKDGNRWNCHIDNLRWGTPKENADDKRRHGTMARGEKHWSTKVNREILRKIRSELTTKKSIRSIGRMFGLSHKTISDIRDNKRWKDIS